MIHIATLYAIPPVVYFFLNFALSMRRIFVSVYNITFCNLEACNKVIILSFVKPISINVYHKRSRQKKQVIIPIYVICVSSRMLKLGYGLYAMINALSNDRRRKR